MYIRCLKFKTKIEPNKHLKHGRIPCVSLQNKSDDDEETELTQDKHVPVSRYMYIQFYTCTGLLPNSFLLPQNLWATSWYLLFIISLNLQLFDSPKVVTKIWRNIHKISNYTCNKMKCLSPTTTTIIYMKYNKLGSLLFFKHTSKSDRFCLEN